MLDGEHTTDARRITSLPTLQISVCNISSFEELLVFPRFRITYHLFREWVDTMGGPFDIQGGGYPFLTYSKFSSFGRPEYFFLAWRNSVYSCGRVKSFCTKYRPKTTISPPRPESFSQFSIFFLIFRDRFFLKRVYPPKNIKRCAPNSNWSKVR